MLATDIESIDDNQLRLMADEHAVKLIGYLDGVLRACANLADSKNIAATLRAAAILARVCINIRNRPPRPREDLPPTLPDAPRPKPVNNAPFGETGQTDPGPGPALPHAVHQSVGIPGPHGIRPADTRGLPPIARNRRGADLLSATGLATGPAP